MNPELVDALLANHDILVGEEAAMRLRAHMIKYPYVETYDDLGDNRDHEGDYMERLEQGRGIPRRA
jgi:hypothetical protein